MKHRPPWYYLILLILAGEAVFILPFVLPRIFRSTVLDVFQLNNVQLGLCFSVYGFVALAAYIFGGPIADKFPPRKIMATGLWATSFGGLYFAQFPSLGALQTLYGYWGFTTIFLFWAPMIKATRVWGGNTSQGRAFGFLDGGRGLVGALFGVLGVLVFSFFISGNIEEATFIDRQHAFRTVIYIASTLIAIIGVFVWFFMKSGRQQHKDQQKLEVGKMMEVLKLPSVWLLMIIILCAYMGYKVTDIIAQYAKEVMLYDEVQAAQTGTVLQFLRPLVGILLGIFADRLQVTRLLLWSFIFSFFGAILFASGMIAPTTTILFFFSVLIIGMGVYAGRSLYFSVMQAGKIPLALTGTAVGMISLLGYTPDIFAGPAYGYLLDMYPQQEAGHQNVFWLMSGFALVGGIAAFIYYKRYGKKVY